MSNSEDAAALLRVRNRIADTPDENLPFVLAKLLPRLLARFPPQENPSNLKSDQNKEDAVDVDPNLVGIFEHIRERVLLNQKTLVQPEWVSSLLEAALPSETGASSWVHYKYSLPILEIALVQCDVEIEGALAKLICILESIYCQALTANLPRAVGQRRAPRRRQQNDANEYGDVEMEEAHDSNSPVTITVDDLKTAWERVSWMIIEQIAKKSKLPPVLDWNYVGDSWDDLLAGANSKKIQDFTPSQEERSVSKDGLYSLFLDFIAFDPTNRALEDSRWQFRRQVHSIWEDFAQVSRQQNREQELLRRSNDRTRNLIIAPDRNTRRTNPTLWNEAELRYWRALKRCGQSFAVQLFSPASQEEEESDDRDDVLRILTGQKKAISSSTKKKRPRASEMYKINQRKQSALLLQEQTKLVCRHKITVGNALLHMLLGDVHATQTIQANQRPDMPAPKHISTLARQPFGRRLLPLSEAMAQRVFRYLLKADLVMGSKIQDVGGRDELEVFLELLKELDNLPSLHVQISNEIYEQIGAQLPPIMCWNFRFLWKVWSQAQASNRSDSMSSSLSNRAWDAAKQVLDRLQDVSVQRFERERRLARMRGSHDRRVYEHRMQQALQSPFVAEALQVRSEAYQLISQTVTTERISSLDSASGRAKIAWDVAVCILNCAAFDLNKEILPALQEACMSVLSVYRQYFTSAHEDEIQIAPINPLLLPLLKASISASDWSREFVLQWTGDVLIHVDPGIAHVIARCLLADEVPLISKRGRDVLKRLPLPEYRDIDTSAVSLFDLQQPRDKVAIMGDLEDRIKRINEAHDKLSPHTACFVSQSFNFLTQAAITASAEDLEAALSRCGYVHNPSEDMAMEDSGSTKECEVCFEDIPDGGGFALHCQHRFCIDCWQGGLAACANAGAKELVSFSCLRHDCTVRATKEDVMKIDPSVVPKLEEALLNMFVNIDKDYTFCPGADCTAVARCSGSWATDELAQEVNCHLCSTVFCSLCGNEPHTPATCAVRLKYQSAVDRVAEHHDSVELKTIECPGCRIEITKNGGCNHMTCTNCGTEFCWICLNLNWQDHVCNVFDSLTGVDDLERVQFFRHRVQAHLNGGQMAQRLLDHFDDHSKLLMDQSRFCDEEEVRILKVAWQTLVAGRKYLANSYIAAYGMTETGDGIQEEFQTHQSQLQLFIEQLSLLSDNVGNISELGTEKDLRRRFMGIHFCSVAIVGYKQRVDSFMRKTALARATL